MKLIYNKEFNCEIQKFKSRILVTTLINEKILEKYKKIWKIIYNQKWFKDKEEKEKKYLNIILLSIDLYIFEIFFININKLVSYLIIFMNTVIIIILYIFIWKL